ncbi:hypothetical protein ACWC5C_38165 [Streptomyces sp. NPDC001700]
MDGTLFDYFNGSQVMGATGKEAGRSHAMMEFQRATFHRQLIATLDALGWDSDQQLEHISQLSVGVDELALEFDDVYQFASGKRREGALPAATTGHHKTDQ